MFVYYFLDLVESPSPLVNLLVCVNNKTVGRQQMVYFIRIGLIVGGAADDEACYWPKHVLVHSG